MNLFVVMDSLVLDDFLLITHPSHLCLVLRSLLNRLVSHRRTNSSYTDTSSAAFTAARGKIRYSPSPELPPEQYGSGTPQPMEVGLSAPFPCATECV